MTGKIADIFTIRKEGGSRVMSVTKIIPDSFKYVDVEVLKSEKNSVTVKINKVR